MGYQILPNMPFKSQNWYILGNIPGKIFGIMVPGFYLKYAIFEFKSQVRSNLTPPF